MYVLTSRCSIGTGPTFSSCAECLKLELKGFKMSLMLSAILVVYCVQPIHIFFNL